MTEQEAKNILLGSLYELKITRADYFRKKCIEGNHDLQSYLLALIETYQKLEAYVNTDRLRGIDSDGNPIFVKQTIYLPDAIGLVNCLDKQDLRSEIWEPFDQFGQSIIARIEKLLPPPPQEKGKQSLIWTGSQAQLDALCEGLKVAGYIDPGTTKEAFKMIFSGGEAHREPVRWKGTNRLLAYTLNSLVYGYKPLIENKDWQSIIEKGRVFQNSNGKYLTANDLSKALHDINEPGFEPVGSNKINSLLDNVKSLRP